MPKQKRIDAQGLAYNVREVMGETNQIAQMQQFVRVQQNNTIIPALVTDAGLLDLRSLVTDITPATIASGVLSKVDTAAHKPLSGEVRYLAPIDGINQIPATGFNYKQHIAEMKVPTPT